MERCGAHAKLVLDAETVVQVYSAVSDDALAQVIREYAQKTQNLQSTVCDQLRRQINNLRAQNESISATDPNAIIEQLSAETRQLEMEREQLQRRLTAHCDETANAGRRSRTEQHDTGAHPTLCRAKGP